MRKTASATRTPAAAACTRNSASRGSILTITSFAASVPPSRNLGDTQTMRPLASERTLTRTCATTEPVSDTGIAAVVAAGRTTRTGTGPSTAC